MYTQFLGATSIYISALLRTYENCPSKVPQNPQAYNRFSSTLIMNITVLFFCFIGYPHTMNPTPPHPPEIFQYPHPTIFVHVYFSGSYLDYIFGDSFVRFTHICASHFIFCYRSYIDIFLYCGIRMILVWTYPPLPL